MLSSHCFADNIYAMPFKRNMKKNMMTALKRNAQINIIVITVSCFLVTWFPSKRIT